MGTKSAVTALAIALACMLFASAAWAGTADTQKTAPVPPMPETIPVVQNINLMAAPIVTDNQQVGFAVGGWANVGVDATLEVSTTANFTIMTGTSFTTTKDNYATGVFKVGAAGLLTSTLYHWRLTLTNGTDVTYYPSSTTTATAWTCCPGTTMGGATIGRVYPRSNNTLMGNFLVVLQVQIGGVQSFPMSTISGASTGTGSFTSSNLRSSVPPYDYIIPTAGSIVRYGAYGMRWSIPWSNNTIPGGEPQNSVAPAGTGEYITPYTTLPALYDIRVDGGHYEAVATGPVGSSNSLGPFNITFQPNCGCFGMYDDIYYSNDNNATWNYVGSDAMWGDGLMPFTAPGPGTYWWYAKGSDMAPPGMGTPAEAGPYVITGSPVSYGIPIQIGWNMISTPVDLPSMTLPAQLLDGDVSWTRVMAYNSSDSSDHWKQYNSEWSWELNDLSRVEISDGFWIFVTGVGDGYLNLTGYEATNTAISLKTGWNLVGYPSQTSRTVVDAFWGTGVDIVEVFDAGQPYLTSAVGASYVMTPGKGYWVHVNSDTVWAVDW